MQGIDIRAEDIMKEKKSYSEVTQTLEKAKCVCSNGQHIEHFVHEPYMKSTACYKTKKS